MRKLKFKQSDSSQCNSNSSNNLTHNHKKKNFMDDPEKSYSSDS